MASSVPDELMMNSTLIKELADVAKDEALLQGVLMRTKETPNSSEVHFFKHVCFFVFRLLISM